MQMSLLQKNIILIGLALVLATAPLVLLPGAAFEGADGLAEETVLAINPAYTPWFEPFLEPPSGEVESFLFSLQAALGAGIIGFILGRMSACPLRDDNDADHR